MNKKLKIISIIFGVAYLFVMGEKIVTNFAPAFAAGFQEGFNSVKVGEDGKPKVKEHLKTNDFLCFYVKVKNGFLNFPTELRTENGQTIKTKTEMFYTMVDNPTRPTWIVICNAITVFFSFVMIAILIYIPIVVWKIIRSVTKESIFNRKNIKRLFTIAYMLIVLFLMGVFGGITGTVDARNLIQLSDYNIVFSLTMTDYMILLFGLVCLLFAEVLNISTQIKEENDLTV